MAADMRSTREVKPMTVRRTGILVGIAAYQPTRKLPRASALTPADFERFLRPRTALIVEVRPKTKRQRRPTSSKPLPSQRRETRHEH